MVVATLPTAPRLARLEEEVVADPLGLLELDLLLFCPACPAGSFSLALRWYPPPRVRWVVGHPLSPFTPFCKVAVWGLVVGGGLIVLPVACLDVVGEGDGGMGGAALKVLTPLHSVMTWEVNCCGGGVDFVCGMQGTWT